MAGDETARRITFARDSIDKLPAGWQAGHTGTGGGGIWKVSADDTAPSQKGYVLSQGGASPGAVFNLCVADGTSYKNVAVTVAFKANQGKKDQGGGIVWRFGDANNYYVARFNPLEDNYRLYKVVAGKRVQLATKEDITAPTGQWHTLSIKMTGNKIECFLDGKKYLDCTDATFPQAGQVGLWTKADAQTSFDLFEVKELKK